MLQFFVSVYSWNTQSAKFFNNAKKIGFLNKFVCFYKMLLASLSYILFGEARERP